jgi:hypothetical protein
VLAVILAAVSSAKRSNHSVPSANSADVTAPPANELATETKQTPPVRIIPVRSDNGMSSFLKKLFLREDDTVKMDPRLLNVPVWTYQRSGFYYCADSPEIEKLKNGSLMTQAEALQSGYKPILGSYCY